MLHIARTYLENPNLMRLRYLLFLLTLVLGGLPAFAQKVKTKSEKVEIKHLVFPTRPLPKAVRTYSRSVSAASETVQSLGASYPKLEANAALPGYQEVALGDVHVEIIPSAVITGQIYSKKKESREKDKDGKEVVSVSFEAYVPTYFNFELRVIEKGGRVLHHELFGAPEGAPSGDASARPVGAYQGERLAGPTTDYRFDLQLDGSWPSQNALQRSVDQNWAVHRAGIREQVVNFLAQHLRGRLRELGYFPTSSLVKLEVLKEGHPETEPFKLAYEQLNTALSALAPGTGVAQAQSSTSASVDYFAKLAAANTSDDKEQEKLREAALTNLIIAHYFLEQFDQLDAVLASLSESESKWCKRNFDFLEVAVKDQIPTVALDSRYDAPFSGQTSAETATALVPMEAITQEDRRKAFNLQDQEIAQVSRDNKIGLQQNETEFAGKAFGGKAKALDFTAVCAPRLITQTDSDSKLWRAIAGRDEPTVLGKNVRGYVKIGADNISDINFRQIKSDTLLLGERILVRLDIKLNLLQRQLLSLPDWYEVVHVSDGLSIYQHAFYAPTVVEEELSEDASYSIVKTGDDPFHTNSLESALTPLKSLSKHLACPAVDAWLAEANPQSNYYTYHEIGKLYASSCQGK